MFPFKNGSFSSFDNKAKKNYQLIKQTSGLLRVFTSCPPILQVLILKFGFGSEELPGTFKK